jgi:electron transport complex protein RnfC
MLIDAILHLKVPPGKLPLDVEVVVNNVGTAAAMADFFETGKPLIERVVTVTGDAVRRPANLMVPLGTPLRAVLEHCGGIHPDTRQVILGGPMMGMAQKDLDVPIVKGASGILAFTRPVEVREEEPCIRCGRCLEACPMFLNPSRVTALVRAERAEGLKPLHIQDCFECASCSFTCPSRIPLVQFMRVGKAMLRQYEAANE